MDKVVIKFNSFKIREDKFPYHEEDELDDFGNLVFVIKDLKVYRVKDHVPRFSNFTGSEWDHNVNNNRLTELDGDRLKEFMEYLEKSIDISPYQMVQERAFLKLLKRNLILESYGI